MPPTSSSLLDQASWFEALNPAQRQVVMHGEGPLLVLAGAGSGKTRAITCRMARLVLEEQIPPWQILALTFTNRAAGEMAERVSQLCGPQGKGLTAGTFHSFCARSLRRFAARANRTPRFAIYDDDDQGRLLKRLMKQRGLSPRLVPVNALRRYIESIKRSVSDPGTVRHPAELTEEQAHSIYNAYQKALAQADAFDFADLLAEMVRLLQDNQDIREVLQSRYRYVLVDEYQDTDRSQSMLLDALCGAYGNLVVVGDDDQAIYGWRGADVGNILRFPETHPGCPVIRLEQNYRSTARILMAADAVIARNQERMGKTLIPTREEGTPVEQLDTASAREEAARVAREILNALSEDGSLNDFAIFYRINAQSRSFEEALRSAGLPFEVVGGVQFYGRAEVKDVLAYARLAINPADSVACLRVINMPARRIGKRTVEGLLASPTAQEQGVWEAIGRLDGVPPRASGAVEGFRQLIESLADAAAERQPSDLIRHIIEVTGYDTMLQARDDESSMHRIANLDELLVAASEYEENTEEPSLAGFLERTALHTGLDDYQGLGDRVTMMTLHGAKGLEFTTVFLTGLEEGLFPLRRRETMDEEEERRLCYVGMTRARDRLVLSWARRRMLHGETRVSSPSRFLRDLPRAALAGRIESVATNSWDDSDHLYRDEEPPDDFFDEPEEAAKLPSPGSTVYHSTFGAGTVVGSYGMGPRAHVAVSFPVQGIRRILASYLSKEEPSA